MVLGTGSVALAPLAPLAALSSGAGSVKQDVKRALPPLPPDAKPVGLGLPPPEEVANEAETRAREVASYPLRLVEGGALPPPHQLLREIEARKPFERARGHVESLPTPYRILKSLPPLKDIPTPRDFASDVQRAMADAHEFMENGSESARTQLPILIENSKQAHTDLTALRHSGVEFARALGKATTRVAKSSAKMFEDFAEGGLTGALF